MPTSGTEGDAFLLNDVVVTYANGKNIYVKDASGYMLVYDNNSAISGAANGKVLHDLWGKAKLYNGLPEISTVTQAPTVIDGTAVEPIELNTYPTDADLNKYVTLEDVTFASAATLSGSVTNIDGTFKETTLILRNQFKLNGVSVATGKSYRVVGVVQKYNETYQVYPITITEIVEAGAPEAPTFSVAAGTYTSVQSVELECTTAGATIYYTTNGGTPDEGSTEYTSAISVEETMTIKAIAIKDGKSSSVAEAAYTINLPENEEVRKTWDLSIASYSANSEDQVTWSATYVSMVADKHNSSQPANNYLGGDANNRTSSRFYKDSKLTITPNGKTITSIVFTATSTSYATALANSAWTNATAAASSTTVTVTATDGDAAVSAVIGATCGFTAVQVNYITDTRVAAGLTWSTDAVEITLGELFSAPTLNNPNSIAAGEITIESNNTALATVAGGVVSLVENATGTATITASFAGNASYKATEVSYTIKVNKPLSPWASVYTSNVTLSTEGGTSASAAKVIFDETEGGYDAIKAGTGSVSGAVKITVPAQATTLHYHAYGWNGEDVTLSITAPTGVTISPESQAIISNAGVSSNSPFTLKNDPDPKNDAYYSVDLSGNDEEIELTFTATTGNRFVLFGVNQEGGVLPVLESIEISGDLTTKTGYKVGDDLDLDGLAVSATYSLGGVAQTPVDITDKLGDGLTLTYDPLVEGQTEVTITATYEGETDDINITLDEAVASADPKIYVDKLNVNFGTVAKDAVVENKKITVTLTNVATATATLGGDNPEAFNIDKTALVDGDEITISVVSTATLGSYSATITISDDADNATDKVVNLSLTIEDVETPVGTTSQWVAATAADLVDGAEVLITGVKNEVTYAMGAQRNNNRGAVAGTLDGEGVFTPCDKNIYFSIESTGATDTYYIKSSNGKYLYNASTSGNSYLRLKDAQDDASWTITLSGNEAIITSVENTNRTIMRFNKNGSNDPLFCCYASGQEAIALYVPKPVTPPTKEVIRGDLSAGKWGTICPKQTVENVEGATFYQISYLEEQGGLPYNVVFDEIEGKTLTAGKPYFFIAEGEEIRGNKTGAELTEAGDGVNGFYGYISSTDASMELTTWHADYTPGADNTFVIYNNSVFRINQGGTMLKSERCYININSTVPSRTAVPKNNARRRVVMGVQGTQVATGLENGGLMNDEMVKKVLIDGTMYIIRGEKMYDTTGQLVK